MLYMIFVLAQILSLRSSRYGTAIFIAVIYFLTSSAFTPATAIF
jgi:hypothetical protein